MRGGLFSSRPRQPQPPAVNEQTIAGQRDMTTRRGPVRVCRSASGQHMPVDVGAGVMACAVCQIEVRPEFLPPLGVFPLTAREVEEFWLDIGRPADKQEGRG